MFQNRWLLLQGVVLGLGFLCLSSVTAQRGAGGGMCPFAMSMSSQMNVQVNFRPNFSSTMNQFGFNPSQNRFSSQNNMFARQTSSTNQHSCTSNMQSTNRGTQTGTRNSQMMTSHQAGLTTQHNCTSSNPKTSTFNQSLVNLRTTMQFGTQGRPSTTQPTSNKVTTHTTIGLRFNTHTLSTTHRSTYEQHQINLLTSSGNPSSIKKSTLSTGTRQQLTSSAAKPVVQPTASQPVKQPVAMPSFLTVPPLQVTTVRDLVIVVQQPQPVLVVPTATKTTTGLARPAITNQPVVLLSTTTVSTRPVDPFAILALTTPALPVSQTTQPLLFQTAEILDRLPTAPSLTVASKIASNQTPLTLADLLGAPSLPGGTTLSQLVQDAPDQTTVAAQSDSYRDPPALPAD